MRLSRYSENEPLNVLWSAFLNAPWNRSAMSPLFQVTEGAGVNDSKDHVSEINAPSGAVEQTVDGLA